MSMQRVGIKDVAKEAGVSASTVSYVLNNTPTESISEDTRKRVMAAVKKLRYVPNLNARSLSSRRSNLIGVLIPQTEPGKEFMFSNPFYGELLSSIEYTARQQGYHLLLSGTQEDHCYLNIAQNRDVDGIIIVGTYPGENLNELKRMGVPIVLVDSYVMDKDFHTIGIEDKEGARMATRYLIGKGHRRIAFISGSIRENGVNMKRYQGYCDALQEAGLTVDESAFYSGTVDYEYGLTAAQQYLDRGRQQTAAFITADVLSMGFIKGLREQKVCVPDDISIVSFDDVYLANMTYPSLTTVHQDIGEKGRKAVELVLEAAKAKEHRYTECILPLRLVERDSVREWREPT
ncbi:MAG TPA: LacI family transcriptional regulator [Clostridiales bacterium]|nr:LacI family transcriptional regulator [Clostridiales bacterium]